MILASLLLALSGCSALAPFETTPSLTESPDTETVVAICYNRLAATEQQMRDAAAQACTGGTPRPVRKEWDLSHCPLLTPVSATFACDSH